MDNDTIELTDQALDALLLSAKTVTPAEKKKLKGLLRYYAKKPHPFRACVRDNMKRFGPGKTEAYCAVLKDLIRGTTKWRGKNNPKDKGTAGLSEDFPDIDDRIAIILSSITEEDIERANQIMLGEQYVQGIV